MPRPFFLLGFVAISACASAPPPEPAPPLAEPAPRPAAPAATTAPPAAPEPAAPAATTPAATTAAPAAKAPPEVKIESNFLRFDAPVSFETAGDKLTAESAPALEAVKKYLDDKSYITTLRIEGHTDDATPGGQALSEKRAMAVARWLIGRGVDCKRLLPVGFGATKPVASGATPEGKAKNRRIEFANAELRGKAIGGMPLDGGGKVAGDACK